MALARGRAHHVSLDFVVINYLTGGARSEDNAVVQQVPTPHLRLLRLLLPPAPRRCIIASKKRAREVVRETRKEIDALSLSPSLFSVHDDIKNIRRATASSGSVWLEI